MAMTDPPAVSATSSDADLITAARSGDTAAYGILYERHSPRALRLARQISGGEADADDIVAETFAKVLAAIKGGAGPTEVFLPYLLTSVRRVAYDHVRELRTQIPTDDDELADRAEPIDDPAEASLDRNLVARAFDSLPERWAAVLWLAEVEDARPAEVALLLGISANSVASLRYRAREGLRQAYLQMHVSHARRECQPVAAMLGGYVRGALSRRDARQVDEHLSHCTDCEAARGELDAINGSMRGVLAPVILGSAAAGYTAHGGHLVAAARWLTPATRTLQRIPWHRAGVQMGAGVAVAVIATVVTLARPHQASPGATGPFGSGPPGMTDPVARSGGAGGSGGSGGHAGPGGPGQPASPGPSPSAAPTGHDSNSPRPSPSGSASGPPTPSPTTSPRPGPTGPGAAADLSVSLTVSGLLNLGLVDVVSVTVSDPGTAATEALTANVHLPAGITLLGIGSGSSGWTCSGTSCRHPAIGAGAATTVSLRILVASLAGCGKPVSATAISGALSASGRSAEQVQCAG
jgi:RNA polymerase sigma factor (sigma-70 family)